MPEICPFLAASHDPDSVLNYPSSANVCTKLGDPLPVANEHQAGYCLRARHWFCPVYAGAVKQPPTPIQFDDDPPTLPSRPIRSRRPRPSPAQRLWESKVSIAILVLIALGAVGYGVWRNNNPLGLMVPTATATLMAGDAPTSSVTPTATSAPSDTPMFTYTPTLTATPTASFTPSDTPTATATSSPTSTSTSDVTPKACQVPVDWQPYTVAPGETYFHIAVKFGTTVDTLQRVNCLANPERLLAGQVINVPPTPVTPTKAL